jgi:hypothetical protein
VDRRLWRGRLEICALSLGQNTTLKTQPTLAVEFSRPTDFKGIWIPARSQGDAIGEQRRNLIGVRE